MNVIELQVEIANWADDVFPDRQPTHLLAKMLEEIGELISNPEDPFEAADLGILVLDYFHLIGYDMQTCVLAKMEINKGRSWKMNPNTMIMSHVEENDGNNNS
jgi:hypothetical protein